MPKLLYHCRQMLIAKTQILLPIIRQHIVFAAPAVVTYLPLPYDLAGLLHCIFYDRPR
jgi:hypothetical protein